MRSRLLRLTKEYAPTMRRGGKGVTNDYLITGLIKAGVPMSMIDGTSIDGDKVILTGVSDVDNLILGYMVVGAIKAHERDSLWSRDPSDLIELMRDVNNTTALHNALDDFLGQTTPLMGSIDSYAHTLITHSKVLIAMYDMRTTDNLSYYHTYGIDYLPITRTFFDGITIPIVYDIALNHIIIKADEQDIMIGMARGRVLYDKTDTLGGRTINEYYRHTMYAGHSHPLVVLNNPRALKYLSNNDIKSSFFIPNETDGRYAYPRGMGPILRRAQEVLSERDPSERLLRYGRTAHLCSIALLYSLPSGDVESVKTVLDMIVDTPEYDYHHLKMDIEAIWPNVLEHSDKWNIPSDDIRAIQEVLTRHGAEFDSPVDVAYEGMIA